MKKSGLKYALTVLLLLVGIKTVRGQFFELPSYKKKVVVHFKMIRNMVVVKTLIDGKGPYNFIIDSGVGIIIITDPALADSVGKRSKRVIKLSGLGSGNDFEANINFDLRFDFNGVTGEGFSAAVLKDDKFMLSNYAGTPIHGLIGFEFFNNLAVKFNFTDSTLTLAPSGKFKEFRKGYKIPITIEQNKPYIQARVKTAPQKEMNAKLLIDFGAGHPLSLENMQQGLDGHKKYITANLGIGLAGPISGFLGRVDEIDIGKYSLNNIITSFPDVKMGRTDTASVKRSGSIGLGILKRFNLIVDYQNKVMFLKPLYNYKRFFEHDMSGMEYIAGGKDFNTIIISRIDPGSTADQVGLQQDDIILAINFKPTAQMSIEQIDDILKSGDNRSLLMDVERQKKHYRFILTLKRRI